MKGDPCQDMWYGIKCSEEGRVIEINLFNNSLSGQLPPEIGNLTSLQSLRLYNNIIRGDVPQELFNLRQIQVLDLDFNGLHGNLPAEFISPQLTNLTIACNYFEGFLPSIWTTPKLRYLNIYQNLFSGPIPDGLGSAKELVEVELSSNHFSSILPDKLGNLKKLEKIHLSDNQYRFNELPDDWSGMENLRHLEMEGVVGGDLPYWIGTSWKHLEVLDLSDGQLMGYISDDLCGLSILNTLRLTYNSLEGDIPSCICNLSPLVSLQLGSNSFTGHIPDCLNNLVNLDNLDMSSNDFTGTLPLSIAELKRLTSVDFGYNEGIYGEIPSQYSKLAGQLQNLGLSRTHLTSFGDGLGELFEKLPTCYLYDVPFHCPLPSYLSDTHCFAQCSNCSAKYDTCGGCVTNDRCGWCTEGHAICLEGTATHVNYTWDCNDSSWIYGSRNKCPTKIL